MMTLEQIGHVAPFIHLSTIHGDMLSPAALWLVYEMTYSQAEAESGRNLRYTFAEALKLRT